MRGGFVPGPLGGLSLKCKPDSQHFLSCTQDLQAPLSPLSPRSPLVIQVSEPSALLWLRLWTEVLPLQSVQGVGRGTKSPAGVGCGLRLPAGVCSVTGVKRLFLPCKYSAHWSPPTPTVELNSIWISVKYIKKKRGPRKVRIK